MTGLCCLTGHGGCRGHEGAVELRLSEVNSPRSNPGKWRVYIQEFESCDIGNVVIANAADEKERSAPV